MTQQYGLPQLLRNRYGNPSQLASITITDTNVHSYLTDPNSISIFKLGTSMPPISSFAIWVYNGENQTLTVTPITNIVNDGSYPDANLTSNTTIEPGYTEWLMFPFDDYPVEYLSLYLSYATAPTQAANPNLPFAVLSNLYMYYR